MLTLILSSGAIGVVILLLFLLAMTLFIERIIVFLREGTAATFLDEFEELTLNHQFDAAAEACERYKGNLAELYMVAVQNRDKGPAALRNILFRHVDLTIIPRLRMRLGLISTIGKGAPMLGLMGTVWGMIGAFATIAGAEGQGVDPKDLAGDIGMALGTTFLGLLVALPVVFASTYLRAKVEKFEVDLERYAQYCLDLLYA